MRHRVKTKKFSRTAEHRLAMVRNLVASLVHYGKIHTTVQKAKYAAPFAERMVTLAKVKTLHRYRHALALLPDEDAVHRLFTEIGPHFKGRPGGYTRVVKLPRRRVGDNAQPAILEYLDIAPSAAKQAESLTAKQAPKGAAGLAARMKGEKAAAAGGAG